jgi:hypothetical protein
MLSYYVELAVRSLRRNVVLTTLMIAAIGIGIGASGDLAGFAGRVGSAGDCDAGSLIRASRIATQLF